MSSFSGHGDSLLTRGRLSPDAPSDTMTVAGIWEGAVADPFGRIPDRAPWNNGLPVLSQLRPLVLPLPRPTRVSTWAVAFPSYARRFVARGARGDCRRPCLTSWVDPAPGAEGSPYRSAKAALPRGAPPSGCRCTGTRAGPSAFRPGSPGDGAWGRPRRGWAVSLPGRVPADPRWGAGIGLALESVEDTTVLGGANIEEGTRHRTGRGALLCG